MEANNPIETNAFRHFLKFTWGELEIFEPEGFDASSFTIERGRGRWGVDIYYGNAEIDLNFGDEIGPPRDTPITLNDGTILEHLTSGLTFLLEEDKNNGPESEVYYVLKLDGVDFIVGALDFGGRKTDEATYFKCNIVKGNEQFLIKKREDVKVDLFSSEDLDGNAVTPLQTKRVLLKAKPVRQVSKWEYFPQKFATGGDTGVIYRILRYWFPTRNLIGYGIADSFTPLNYSAVTQSALLDRFRIIKAVELTTDINYALSFSMVHNHKVTSAGTSDAPITRISLRVRRYRAGVSDPLNYVQQTLFTHEINSYTSQSVVLDEDLNVDGLHDLNPGDGLYFFLDFEATAATIDPDISLTSNIKINNMSLEVQATEIAPDTVIDAARYVDVVKETYKRIGALPVSAPILESGGPYFNNFCATGKLLRQLKTEPFYSSVKEVVESFAEFAGDFQINDDNILVATYSDFYANEDMGGFLELPDVEAEQAYNERYLINKFNFKYKKFEQDRDEDNTLDAIHTASEWFIPNNNSQDEQRVECNYIRDAYMLESVRRRATQKVTTSDSSDDDVFIFEVVDLPPGSRGNYTNF